MSVLPQCPQCHSPYTYEDNSNYVCPECAHEWSQQGDESQEENTLSIKDANGNLLQKI